MYLNNLILSSSHASSERLVLHIPHGSDSRRKTEQPSKSFGFTVLADSTIKSQSVSGINKRLAPAAFSGRSSPWGHLIEAVGPESASHGASRVFLRNHCCSLTKNKKCQCQQNSSRKRGIKFSITEKPCNLVQCNTISKNRSTAASKYKNLDIILHLSIFRHTNTDQLILKESKMQLNNQYDDTLRTTL